MISDVIQELEKELDGLSILKIKPLVIIDLNDVIIKKIYKPNMTEEQMNKYLAFPHSETPIFYIWMRPRSQEFIEFLFENFKVGIWSAALRHNITDMLKIAFTEKQISELVVILDQSHCEKEEKITVVKDASPYLFKKNLTRVWDELNLPPYDRYEMYDKYDRHEKYDKTNTTIVDDTLDKIRCNPEETICVAKKEATMDDFLTSEYLSVELIPILTTKISKCDIKK